MTLQELKEEARKEFDEKFVDDRFDSINEIVSARPNYIKDFIDALIEKAFEEGKKYAIESIAEDQGWEESEQYFKEKLLKSNS